LEIFFLQVQSNSQIEQFKGKSFYIIES